MIILKEVGGVRVFGVNADRWLDEAQRQILGYPVCFDGDVYSPDCDEEKFLFPVGRGQTDYQVQLLETGVAIVIKEGKAYVCTKVDGEPCVLTFIAVPSDMSAAVLL